MTLGEFLRQEREKQGFTIEQVASATKIGIRILHSLEADHYAELPARPFIRGFVISYCRFIGIDSKEVLSKYDGFIHEKLVDRPNRDAGHSGYAFEKKDGEQQSRTFLSIAIGGFIVIGGIAMLILKPSLHHSRKSHLEKLRTANPEVEMTASPTDTAETAVAKSVLGAPAAPAPHQVALVKPAVSPAPARVESPVSESSPEPVAVTAPVPAPAVAAPILVPSPVVVVPIPVSAPVPAPVAPPVLVPAPTQSPAVGPVPLESLNLISPNPNDPLDSGLSLKTDEIRQKVIFTILSDVWVRYRVDERPIRKFIVRKGKTLVLRAKDGIRFQVSDPMAVTFNYNRHGTKPLADEKKSTKRGGNFTVFFPHELAETIEKPFGDTGRLPTQAPPLRDGISQQ